MNETKNSVGARLKAAREAKGRSIEAIAGELCLRSAVLDAIEKGDLSALPESTFATGFVRSYAQALGLDGNAFAADFRAEHDLTVAQPIVIAPQMLAPKRAMPRWITSAGGLAAALGAWFVVSSGLATYQTAEVRLTDDRTAIELAELAEVKSRLAETAPAVKEEVAATAADAPSSDVNGEEVPAESFVMADAAPVPYRQAPAARSIFPAAVASEGHDTTLAPNALAISASEESWVLLESADGNEVWSGILKEGETFRPAIAGEAVFLTTSNAGGVRVSFQNQQLGRLGERGEIVAGLRLDASRVPATSS